MLDIIEDFLSQHMSPEYTQSRLDTIKLIVAQGLTSPVETILEAIYYKDSATPEDIVAFIDEILNNFLTDILSNFYIMIKGEVEYKTKFLQALNLLDDYIDSDVILEKYEDDLAPDEALVQLLAVVGSESVEYYDEFLIDVRPQLLERLISKHEMLVDSEVIDEESEDRAARINEVRVFKGTHGDTFATDAVINGTIKTGTPLHMMLNLFTSEIYKLSSPTEIAKNIYSLVLVSDTAHDDVNVTAMNLVTDLYNDVLVGRDISSELSEYTTRR